MIRHSVTAGNLEGRYIGSRTDEPLCEEGIRLLKSRSYPPVDRIYVSPMRRCVETAGLLWKEVPMIQKPDLRECDFGTFENKNYQELDGNPAYQAWIDSGGVLPFPEGESMEQFKARCRRAFEEIVEETEKEKDLRAAIVAHGGTIMAILEEYGLPKRAYFDYQVKNGCGYLLTPAEGTRRWNCQYLP